MTLSRSSVIKDAENISNKVTKIGKTVTLISSDIDDVLKSMKLINNKIIESVRANDINQKCNSLINDDLAKTIQSTMNHVNSFATSIVSDGNKCISYLENCYNSSLKEGEDRLSLQRIPAINSQGRKTFSLGKTSNGVSQKKPSTSQSNSRSSSNNSSTSLNINDDMDKVLKINNSNNIDTNSISDWDAYIRLFLQANNLEDILSSISLSNHKVVCVLKNRKTHNFDNITSSSQLIEAIKSLYN